MPERREKRKRSFATQCVEDLKKRWGGFSFPLYREESNPSISGKEKRKSGREKDQLRTLLFSFFYYVRKG
jgi:hypothetical protein